MTRKNHNTETSQNYCSQCGQPTEHRKIDGHYVWQEIAQLLNFEKGLPYTVRELTIHPGRLVRRFLEENNTKIVKPVSFLIVTSLIFYISDYFFHFQDDVFRMLNREHSAAVTIFRWIMENQAYSNLMAGFFIALWLKVLFRKHHYNYFEILVLLCFLMGMGMLIFSIFGIARSLMPFIDKRIGDIVGYIYCAWGIGQFFDKRKIMSYVKGFTAFFTGVFSFVAIAYLVGAAIDFFLKN